MTQNNSFKDVLNRTLKFEGGYTEDTGGPTNYGVRQDMYDAYAKANKLESKKVTDLKYGDVKNFYEKDYWEKPKISKLPAEIAGNVFDYGVNAGQGKAIKTLQEVVGAKPDGVIGPKTLKAVNDYMAKVGAKALNKQILDRRAQHYNELVQSNPQKYSRYLNGWLARVNKLAEQ